MTLKYLALYFLTAAHSLGASIAADKWSVTKNRESDTHPIGVIASLESIENNAILAIKCDQADAGSIYLHFVSKHFLGRTGLGVRSVSFRFDDQSSDSLLAYHKGNNAVVSNAAPDSSAGKFILSLIERNSVILALSSATGERHISKFELGGSKKAIGEIVRFCKAKNWYGLID
ncbi:hypothetical protein [Sphingorhabdus sp. Alg231-15]|uniref:hypothetical protein n=1 Tax=Sphingorhabdus sp. Alg231-15 TaxID=1922222 RepID=UPI000D54DFEA